jgi:hypothetical protein
MINYEINGFSKFEISKKDYDDFIKKTKKDIYIKFKETQKIEMFLEIEDKDINKVKNTLIYVFYILNNDIYFKMTKLTFLKNIKKEDIIKNKQKIISEIELKIDDAKYNVDSDELLDFTKSKYI